MVQNGTSWFGDLSPNAAVTVYTAGANAAAFVAQSVPANMIAGQNYTVSVQMKNVGTNTWTAASSYRLGSQNPQNNVEADFYSREASSGQPSLAVAYNPPTPATSTERLTPMADAGVANGPYAAMNFGTTQNINANKVTSVTGSYADRVSYLKFDLTGVTSAPNNAQLTLTVSPTDTTLGVSETIGLYWVSDTTWSETGVTWNNAPGLDRVNILSTGTLIGTQTVVPQAGVTLSYDLTAFVAAHLGQIVTLQLLAPVANNNAITNFYSREAPSGQPVLSIVYNGAPLPPATATLSPTADAGVGDGSAANTNFGTATDFALGRASTIVGNTIDRAAYLKFDLTSLSVAPLSALLTLSLAPGNTTLGASLPVSLYWVADTSWTETGITWNNAPGLDRVNIASAGTLVGIKGLALAQGGALTFDVTSFVASHLGQVVTLQLFVDTNPDNTTWGLDRVSLPSSVAPGASGVFSFTVTAPATSGGYSFQWGMLEDGVGWFGDSTPNATVTVGTSAPVPASGVTNFVWDEGTLLAELDSGGNVQARYTHDPDRDDRLVSQWRGGLSNFAAFSPSGSARNPSRSATPLASLPASATIRNTGTMRHLRVGDPRVSDGNG